ncbi:MAG TPA: hypothetical protein VE544_04175 [Nitrososphaeraceae archaeon]|nr:hypothetical protein [Nitrososphaeraceae archaeon]
MIAENRGQKSIIDIFEPDSSPYNVGYSKWTVRWWNWCLLQSKSTNPVNDRKRTDRNASNNQIYPSVWFLAGTTDGNAERECIVPKVRAILCPIINFEISTAEKPDLDTDEALLSRAKDEIDKIENLNVIIDGTRLSNLKKFRVQSGVFGVNLPQDNIWEVKPGKTRAAADGYWIFLKPLPKGMHTLQFNGSCLAGTINIGTNYYLEVR